MGVGRCWQYDQERPDTAASRPGTAASRPGTAATRPGTAASRPGTGQSRPSTGEVLDRARQAARPGTAQARAAAAIKAAGGLENIPEYNPTAIPPAMVPEGWLKTEGGALGEIPIKPHRTPRKVSNKTKKKMCVCSASLRCLRLLKASSQLVPSRVGAARCLETWSESVGVTTDDSRCFPVCGSHACRINLNPSFNPPRELTSYEFVHALSEVMPALYRKVVEVTKAKVFPNLLYVSEYADDLKKVDNSEWGRLNLVRA